MLNALGFCIIHDSKMNVRTGQNRLGGGVWSEPMHWGVSLLGLSKIFGGFK